MGWVVGFVDGEGCFSVGIFRNRILKNGCWALERVMFQLPISVFQFPESGLRQPGLTFSHWSGVSPYTSSYELAGTCVFGKQSPGVLLLQPFPLPMLPFVQRHGTLGILSPGCHALKTSGKFGSGTAGLLANLRPLFCRVP